ncbi:CarD family transcriptional regulator [uncultured Oscillibacter sp.]|uniref:CarD family transcriptional regulator n=1 Tax=uncultured Oscillibacter sp. TaxID=876091 RepID=UPI0025E951B5|nr:CarD family transcriptional regulator [uncultured Oscillibacter sp.]
MFQPGDLVIYGTTGVCRVEEIARPNKSGPDRDRQYYLLKPLHQDGVIYTPADSSKVPMRPVISAKEAEALIDLIPTVEAKVCRAPTLQALAQHYQTAVRSNDCKDLIEMVMSIYAKQKQAEAQKRRLGMVDERYMRQAERLLHGELSAALGIPFEAVPPYIADRVAQMKKS